MSGNGGIGGAVVKALAGKPASQRSGRYRGQKTTFFTDAQTAERRLREAIDILPQGIVFLDSDGRYILWNEQYADIYRRSADLFQPGVKFEDALRVGVARGDYPDACGREEAWIRERIDRLNNPAGRHEQVLADGRCILIEERRTSDGGTIGIRVDITEMKQREASFRLLFESNPVPMFVFAADDRRILAVNDAAVGHYGHDRDSLVGSDLARIHDPAQTEVLVEFAGDPDAQADGRSW